MRTTLFAVGVAACAAIALSGARASARQAPIAPVAPNAPNAPDAASASVVVTKYCISCHNERTRTGGLALDRLDATNPGGHAEIWETVVEKLRAGSMPPPGRPRPDAATYHAAAGEIERALDSAW